MSSFDGKVAIITGAGSGIGRALAVDLIRQGARLALSDVNESGLAETLAQCQATGKGAIRTYRLDVSDCDAVLAHAERVQRDFGAAHFLFNNAGVTLVSSFAHATLEEMGWLLDINLWGVIHCTKAFLPIMLAQREGCIVNLSSVFGLIGFPAQSAYNMSKFAVRGLTEALWYELQGTGVRAVCVHPGGIRTNIEQAGRRSVNANADEAVFEPLARKMLVTPAEDCARDILEGIAAGKRRILTGHRSRTLFFLSRLLPDSYFRIVRRMVS
jgi:NAD(P)-dependent dehydrogenase (short-subunit alcohol dehydrogenase family)